MLGNQAEEGAPSTFGGILPDQNDHPGDTENSISMDDAQPEPRQDELISLKEDGSRPVVDTKSIEQRAAKLHFSLGEESPGVDALKNEYLSGSEDNLRDRLAKGQDLKDQDTKLQVIKDKAAFGDLSPKSVQEMADVSKFDPKNDPNTIVEKIYASNYVKQLLGMGEGANSVLGKAFAEDPEKVAHYSDITAELVMRQEILKGIKEDTDATKKEQSWLGFGVDLAKGLVPGYAEGKLHLNNPQASSSFLKGEILEDKLNYYYALPPSKMYQEVKKDVAALAEDNPQLAGELIDALIKHSASDKFLSNVFTGIDVASVVPFGTMAKVAGKVGQAGRLAKTGAEDAAKIAAGRAARGEATPVAEAAAKAAGEAPEAAQEAFAAAVRANADPVTDVGAMLTNMGDLERGARLDAARRVDEIIAKGDPLSEGKELRKQLNTFNNPEMIVKGGSDNLAASRVERILTTVKGYRDGFQERLTDLVKVGRLPEEALQVAFREAEDRLKSVYNHVQDSILDVKTTYNRPEDNLANVGSVTIRLGQRDGTLFPSLVDAVQAAEQDYKLTPLAYKVKPTQDGLGYTIDLSKHIDETSDGVREAINLGGNNYEPSLANTLFGWARNGIDRTNKFQAGNAQAAVHGYAAIQSAFKEMAKSIGSLSNVEKVELKRVMNADKYKIVDHLEDGTPIRGAYADNILDFEQNFAELHKGNYPTAKQTEAYFVAREISDMEWTVRNLGVFRDKARQGIENMRLFDTVAQDGKTLYQQSKEFGGRFVDNLPLKSNADAGVVIHTKGGEPRLLKLHGIDANAADKAEIQELLKSGHKIVQVENPMIRPFGLKFGENPVSYIITKDFESRPLDWKQVPYRPGWHTEYPQSYFVKQPVIRRAGEEGAAEHIYEGDVSAMAFHSKPEAEKYAKRMDTARLLMRDGKNAELDAFLRSNLPFNPHEFRSLFTPNRDGEVALSLHEPFFHVGTGSNVGDVHGKALAKQYENYQDLVRSPHNLFQNVDKKFMGRRDNPLWTVDEKGSELNPLHLANASEIDPMESVTRAMSNVLRSRFFTDHKVQAVESWVQRFGHLLGEDPELIKANPLYYLHNGTLRPTKDNIFEVRRAYDARKALLELVGTKSLGATVADGVAQKVVDSIYERSGQKASDYAAGALLQSEKDPTRFMRAAVFHTRIGLYNVQQLFLNAMTMTHTVAVSPIHGAASTASFPLMRYAFMNPDHLDNLAKVSSRLGYGKPEVFKEAYEELKRSGKMVIEGEHALRNDLGEGDLGGGMFRKGLDLGLSFFKEGERWSRVTAYLTAFREWKAENPAKIMTELDRRNIMSRSGDLTVNMTRDANAFYQNGLLAIPTQFFSYHTRLAEQMLSGGLGDGGRLTRMEKARAMAMYSTMYGLPTGVGGSFGLGALTGGQYPFGESIKEAMVDRNMSFGPYVDAAIQGGIVDIMATLASGGKQSDLASKVGPTGGQVLKDILSGDKKFIEVLFGATAGSAGKFAESMNPVFNWVASPFRQDNEKYSLTTEDMLHVIRNVKSVDSVLTAYYGLTAGKLLAKKGEVKGVEVNKGQAILQLITGAMPAEVTKSYIEGKQSFDRDKVVKQTMASVEEDFLARINAITSGDDKMAQVYAQNIYTKLKLGGIRPDEMGGVFSQMYAKHQKTIDKVHYDHVFKNAPADKVGTRIENELERKNGNEQ